MHSVLVVDDEPFVRLSVASLAPWSEEGFDFTAEAGDGEEALAVIAARPEIDVVLLDLSMPGMDGLTFLRRLREGGRPAPEVVVLSAHGDFHLVREAFTLGACDYLLKSELDAGALRARLLKAAARVVHSREREAAILERRQVELLEAQLLRDLLAAPAAPALTAALAGLGLALPVPFAVCRFRVADLEAVAAREGAAGLDRFSEMLERSIAQVLARFGRGRAVTLGPGEVATLFAPPAESAEPPEAVARAFCAGAAEYAERYLAVKLQATAGPRCEALAGAAASLAAARAQGGVASRIVVLARRAVRERFADPEFSLEEAAQRAGVSKNHLSYEFSRETGETFVEHLSRVRVEEAKRLLAGTDLHVYEVGERVGYPSVEHFSRVFKRFVGTSPARYKAERGPGGGASS